MVLWWLRLNDMQFASCWFGLAKAVGYGIEVVGLALLKYCMFFAVYTLLYY